MLTVENFDIIIFQTIKTTKIYYAQMNVRQNPFDEYRQRLGPIHKHSIDCPSYVII